MGCAKSLLGEPEPKKVVIPCNVQPGRRETPEIQTPQPQKANQAPEAQYKVGDIVEALFEGEWGEATIKFCNADGTYKVAWSAEESYSVCGVHEIRPRKVASAPGLFASYKMGKMLGQGGFGMVYLCNHLETNKSYAVKMLNKVESEEEFIEEEISLLRRLAGPCCVKLHEVFWEQLFVCLVLELYAGGDLINGMNVQLEAKGHINPQRVRHIIKQCVDGVAWVHSKGYAHRDVKGDNYLLDRKNILDPNCRVFLSDFGTVEECLPTERFDYTAGTKLYWAPELWDRNYGLKVDLWAIGVVSYALVKGDLPFRDERAIRHKLLKLPEPCPDQCRDFTFKLLNRKEKARLTAKQALKHEWLDLKNYLNDLRALPPSESDADEEYQSSVSEYDDEATMDQKSSAKEEKVKRGGSRESGELAKGNFMREIPVNNALDEQRQELVARMKDAFQKEQKQAAKLHEIPLETFVHENVISVESSNNNCITKFEWRTHESLQRSSQEVITLMKSSRAASAKDMKPGTQAGSEAIKKMLVANKVDISQFGAVAGSRPFADFVDEVQTGAARLMNDAAKHKRLVRVVDIVLLRMCHGAGENIKFLVRKETQAGDGGRSKKDHWQLEGCKKEPYENTQQTAERLVKERLGMDLSKVAFNWKVREYFEEEEDSLSYPGVSTVYRKEIVACKLKAKEPPGNKGQGNHVIYKATDAKKITRVYEWLSERQCQVYKLRLKAPKNTEQISTLIDPPISVDEDALMKYLVDSGVDVSAFGTDKYQSFQEFSSELMKGEASIEVQDGKPIRVVDIVVLKLTRNGGEEEEVLLQAERITGGQKKATNRLPATKRRPDENQFSAIQRLLHKNLRMNANYVTIDQQNVKILDEEKDSASFPGLNTLYRKRIITAALNVKWIAVSASCDLRSTVKSKMSTRKSNKGEPRKSLATEME